MRPAWPVLEPSVGVLLLVGGVRPSAAVLGQARSMRRASPMLAAIIEVPLAAAAGGAA